MEAVIDIRDLQKHYGGRAVVDRLTLAVPRGALFALLGENGAGKTTTIRMLTGQVRPDGGSARILGEDCWHRAQALRHRVGYVPERPRFYDWMTVSEIGWFCAGFQARGYQQRYAEACRRFQLNPRAKLQHLSKGQYAEVGLALALALDPEVLILDEPTSGLDLLVRREFLSHMVGLAGAGRTILISSHQIAEVERIASHVAFLHEGRLLLHGSLDDLRRRVVRYRLRFEGLPPDAERLGRVLGRNGTGRQWQAIICDPDPSRIEELRQAENIEDFEEAPLGLEDIYCALMGRQENLP